ncbi:MAG: hypothetical protein JNM17_38520 [Archangium sp.]|nr:hypothetical protein [Archangium sp.]
MDEQPKKHRPKPLLVAGAGIALLTMASGSLSCGNLPGPRVSNFVTCPDGIAARTLAECPDAGTNTTDGGTDGGP